MSELGDVLAALDLKAAGVGAYEGSHLDEGHGVVFGGQILAQTVVAATRAVEGKELLSLHTVFARSATPAEPLRFEVEVLHAGRAMATASVTTSQSRGACTRSTALLHVPDPDRIRHGAPVPAAAGAPDDHAERPPPAPFWEIRIAGDVDISDPARNGPAELLVWSRVPGAPDDATTGQALLAYASDGFLIATAMRPHDGIGQSMAHVSVSTTVLTQTLSFHEPFDAGDWLLLAHRSTYAGRGRSYGTADVFTEDGRHVASFSQDNMIRAFPDGAAPAAGERARH